MCDLTDTNCNRLGDHADTSKIGIDRAVCQFFWQNCLRQCICSSQKHALRNMASAACQYSQAYSRENVGIVALRRMKVLFVNGRWRERAAACENCTSFTPAVSLFRSTFGMRSRVGE